MLLDLIVTLYYYLHFKDGGNGGSEKLSNLPKVIELGVMKK